MTATSTSTGRGMARTGRQLTWEGGGAEGLGPPPPSGWNSRVPREACLPLCLSVGRESAP